jgi:hypothetical protein
LTQFRHWLDDQFAAADREQQREITRLGQTTLGVVEYLPSATGNMQQTLTTLINGVKDKIRERLDIPETDDGTLIARIMRSDQRNAWADALRHYMHNRESGLFVENLLEPVRTMVQDVLQDVLTPLGQSLARLAHAPPGALSPDLDQLQEKLASLLPTGVIPQTHGAKPRVLVTYPGQDDVRVVEYLRNIIFRNGFDGANQDEVFQFAASGDSGSITATINIVGQGLLDSDEVRQLLAVWVEANKQNKQQPATDRLMYRQRVSYENLQDITDVPNRRVILRNFLAALYDGHVSVHRGTIEVPEEIRITKKATNAYFDIPLSSQDGASPWASLFNGFEEKIVTASSLVNPGLPEAIKWFGEYVPSCLVLTGEKPQSPSPLFEEVIRLVTRHREVTGPMQHPPGLTKQAILRREAVHKFWTQDIIGSLTAPYLNVLNASFWCIGAAYVGSGQAEIMRKELTQIIERDDAKIRRMIQEDQQRRNAALENLG